LNIIHPKTNQAHIHLLSDKVIKDLKSLNNEIQIVFEKYKYKDLLEKLKPINKENLIRLVNEDLNKTAEIFELPYNIKSHSFRINTITNLLKITFVYKVT
jgi:hypothetical protein